jgi:hypothetical protein
VFFESEVFEGGTPSERIPSCIKYSATYLFKFLPPSVEEVKSQRSKDLFIIFIAKRTIEKKRKGDLVLPNNPNEGIAIMKMDKKKYSLQCLYQLEAMF